MAMIFFPCVRRKKGNDLGNSAGRPELLCFYNDTSICLPYQSRCGMAVAGT